MRISSIYLLFIKDFLTVDDYDTFGVGANALAEDIVSGILFQLIE
jgi:hypothetical protein